MKTLKLPTLDLSDPWTWLRRAFPVRIFHSLEKVPDFPANEAASSGKSYEPFAWWDGQSLCWRTWERCLIEGYQQFSGRWPRSGMTRSGIAYRRDTLVPRTDATVSGLLPTPTGVNGGRNHIAGRLDEWGGSSNPFRGTEIGKVHCPSFEGWMMGYPEAWHRLTPTETQSSPKSPK